MKNGGRTSLREIAEATGLSRMAVSLALRGRPGVSEANRERVRRAAARLGYAPDPEVAKLLSRIRTSRPAEVEACLALLTSGRQAGLWRLSVTERKYVEGAKARAEDYGYRLEEFWLEDPKMPARRLADILRNRGIEGVVVAPLQGRIRERGSRELKFDFSAFAAVEISETVERPDLTRALHDQYVSMQRTLRELAARGYRRPGLVLERGLDMRTNGRWTAAWMRFAIAADREGAETAGEPLLTTGEDAAAFREWFARIAPDVVVSVDGLGHRLMKACGLRYPRDAGYASLDVDGEPGEFCRVSGIDQNSRLVGAAAVDSVVAAIQRGERGAPEHPQRIEVAGTWVEGASTPGPRA